jgi:hypothetical protein
MSLYYGIFSREPLNKRRFEKPWGAKGDSIGFRDFVIED